MPAPAGAAPATPLRPAVPPGPSPAWAEPFGDSARCVALVRSHARAFLLRAHLQRQLREDALLVISELVTNAIRHTHGPGRVRLAPGPDGLDVEVSDTSRVLPQPRLVEPGTALTGRGLAIVAVLCDTLSVTLDVGSGKTVHAHLAPVPPAPAPGPARPARSW
ncbi:ATP-binding protein [Kitasatospora sp. NPDC094015]|uniref:ATP-binding protein n=1 Tax=Kitasatospora sp. NPDC094015 TaxID=3155205 RepID=UPI0033170B07